MKIFKFIRKQELPITIEEAWNFFSKPDNLLHITPPSLGFVITSDLPPKMYQGMIVTYTVTPILNYPIQWVTEITHLNEPHFFVDEQRFGPYKFWHHQHLFSETKSGVEMTDLIHYALPLGPIGKIANRLFVIKQLNQIFDFRRKYLQEKFGIVSK